MTINKYKYSGIYTSAYSFFDQFPELKPADWDDVQFCDTEDINDALPDDYNIVYGGDWSLESLFDTAKALECQTHLSSDQDLVVFHDEQSETVLTTILDSLGLSFIYKIIKGEKSWTTQKKNM